MHRRQRQQRVIDAVVGENDQRVLGAQTLRQNPGGHRAHLLQRVLVGDGRPRRVHVRALAEKNPVRHLPRPLLQPVADATRAWLQRRGRFQPDTAVGAALGHDLRRREQRFGMVATVGGGDRHGFPQTPSFWWGRHLLYARTVRRGNAPSRVFARSRSTSKRDIMSRIALPRK